MAGPTKWALRVGETAFSSKASASRRRNPYLFSLPFRTAGARVLNPNTLKHRACAQKRAWLKRGALRQPKISYVLPAREALFFAGSSALGLKGWIWSQAPGHEQQAGQEGRPFFLSLLIRTARRQPGRCPTKWAPRIGETAFSSKASASRRRTPYSLSLPI